MSSKSGKESPPKPLRTCSLNVDRDSANLMKKRPSLPLAPSTLPTVALAQSNSGDDSDGGTTDDESMENRTPSKETNSKTEPMPILTVVTSPVAANGDNVDTSLMEISFNGAIEKHPSFTADVDRSVDAGQTVDVKTENVVQPTIKTEITSSTLVTPSTRTPTVYALSDSDDDETLLDKVIKRSGRQVDSDSISSPLAKRLRITSTDQSSTPKHAPVVKSKISTETVGNSAAITVPIKVHIQVQIQVDIANSTAPALTDVRPQSFIRRPTDPRPPPDRKVDLAVTHDTTVVSSDGGETDVDEVKKEVVMKEKKKSLKRKRIDDDPNVPGPSHGRHEIHYSSDEEDEEDETDEEEDCDEQDGVGEIIPGVTVGELKEVETVPLDKYNLNDMDERHLERMFLRQLHPKPIYRRLYGGQESVFKSMQANEVFRKAIVAINKTAEDHPREHIEVNDPEFREFLNQDLKSHQRHALAWMLWREAQITGSGGILADEMGLGKTFSTIALIVAQRHLEQNEPELIKRMRAGVMKGNNLTRSRGTLVVVPASLMHQWESEIKKFVKPNTLSVHIYHGDGRNIDFKALTKKGIVITTYDTVRGECEMLPMNVRFDEDDRDELREKGFLANVKDKDKKKKKNKARPRYASVLQRIAWRRVVLDEAHYIKNHTSSRNVGACHLAAQSRWCITGTPVHNRLRDFYSYLRFLRFAPFDELKVWNMRIDANGKDETSTSKTERLSLITVSMMLRREKAQISTTTGEVFVALPSKTTNVEVIQMSPAERKAYTELAENGRRRVEQILEANGRGANSGMFEMLALITRMRQFCTHPALLKEAMDWESVVEGLEKVPGVDDLAEIARAKKSLADVYDPVLAKQVGKLFDSDNHSCKTAAMIIKTRQVLKDTNDKIVIVSQWTSVLNIVEKHIKREIRGVGIVRIDGKVKLPDRAAAMDQFNKPDGPRVMLLSIMAAGCGLNLIGGNHMILMDLHWNPANELQVYDRLHRMGQMKSVHIFKYITMETIEDRVMQLQKEKEELANDVFKGNKTRAVTKLSIKDIKFLFGIDDASKAKEAALRNGAVDFSEQAAEQRQRANLLHLIGMDKMDEKKKK